MKKSKTNKIIILSVGGIIFIVSLLIFILNYSKDDSSFSILEKKWINDNANNVIDVSVYNDIPVFGVNGNGVIFDFLKQFTTSYEVDFNKVSYVTNNNTSLKDLSFRVLNGNTNLSNNDILMYEDHYVLVAKKDNSIDKISDISTSTIGVLSDDLSNVSYYLVDAKDTSYIPYTKESDLIEALDKDTVNYAVIPMNTYLDDIISNELKILYHFADLTKKYVITVKNNNTLLNIMKKYNIQYQKDYYNEAYKTNFLNLVFSAKKISEIERAGYNATSYTYGYVINMPFENSENNEFVGIISNYLSGMEDLFDVDFKIVKYKNVTELKSALSKGEIDVALDNFNYNGVNVDIIKTKSLFEESYVVLSKKILTIDSVRSLKDIEVNAVSNTYLYDYFVNNSVKVKGYNDTDELLRNISNNSIIVMDKNTYMYYKNGKLANYNVLYENVLNNDYTFIIRDINKNSTFSNLFSFYISLVNYNELKYKYNTNHLIGDTNILGTTLKYLFISLLAIIITLVVVIIIRRKKKKDNIIKKEEKIKFIDIMTSLKNRNYLNYNIKKWDENVIYPQAFVVIDLNNIKHINDNHGHEEGDNVIKKAASILIIHQLEKTDIIRTDGNEFLIYMVGYNESQVIDYTRKISKELKELPYGFGASIGYSMITDDVKTVDDAINEATLEMRTAKEKI